MFALKVIFPAAVLVAVKVFAVLKLKAPAAIESDVLVASEEVVAICGLTKMLNLNEDGVHVPATSAQKVQSG